MTLELAETFVISRGARDTEDVVAGRAHAQRRARLRRGARRSSATTSRPSPRSRTSQEHAGLLGDDPFALEEVQARLPRAGVRGPCRARRGAARSPGQAARTAGVAPARPAARGAADDVDDLARRSRRHGAPGREGARPLQAPEAEARRRRRPRRRTRPRRARGRRRSAPGRRERGLEPRRGARHAAAARRARRRLLRAAAAGRRPGRAGAEARARRSRSTSTRTATRSPTSPPAPSGRTASTSSSRSPAASARRCAWCTPRARSGSGRCSAAWSSPGLGIAAGAHIASLFDHIDLDGNILIAHDPWPGVAFVDGVQVPSDQPGLGVHKHERTRYLDPR